MPAANLDFTKPTSAKRLKRQYQHIKVVWVILAITGAWLGITIPYTFAVCSIDWKLARLLATITSPTINVRVLRILSEGIALLLTALIACTLDTILWTKATTREGISLATLLGLSKGTDFFGLLELLFLWRTSTLRKGRHRFIAAMR
jgi:hypothetical protein